MSSRNRQAVHPPVDRMDSHDTIMKFFARRRLRNAAITVAVLALITLWVVARQRALGNPAFATGYLLFAAIVLLAGYNLRKKLPQFPLGSAAAWLQIHIYVGLGTFVVFVLHAGLRWPTGLLDSTLAVVYLLTLGSGVVGLYLTRTVPAQLTRAGEEVLYERIPMFRRRIRDQARQVVFQTATAAGTPTIADFYTSRLYDFFERPRGWRYLLRPTTKRRRALLSQMQDLRRYLSPDERNMFEQLFALVRRKDDLDFHAARQGMLKGWLVVHISLTGALLLLALSHGLVAHVYWGGAL